MTTLERLFQPHRAFFIVLALALSQYSVLVISVASGTPDFVLGGDFVAFWSAAREILDGNLIRLYAPDGLDAAIAAHRPEIDGSKLFWQYPPHASLIFAPIGLLPFTVAYALWCALGLSVFTAMLIRIGLKGRTLIAALATIPVLIALDTGQNSLFTGSLLLAAVVYAKPRPVLAGLAAGLLTIKPQLGILLPIFFIANGHWRAMLTAAAFSIALFGWSYLQAGAESWTAFFAYLGMSSDKVAHGIMPLYKMVNALSAARLAWIPQGPAIALAGLMFAAGIYAIIWTSRRTSDARWQYAVVATMTLLATPYSMYYELVLLVPALAFVVLQGDRTKWLAFERESIAGLMFISLFLPGPATQIGVSLGFIFCLVASMIVLRRIRSGVSANSLAAENAA